MTVIKFDADKLIKSTSELIEGYDLATYQKMYEQFTDRDILTAAMLPIIVAFKSMVETADEDDNIDRDLQTLMICLHAMRGILASADENGKIVDDIKEVPAEEVPAV